MNEKVKSPGRSPSSRLASPDPSCRMQASPGLFKKQKCEYYFTMETKKRLENVCKNHGINHSKIVEYAIIIVLDIVENVESFDIKKAIEGSK